MELEQLKQLVITKLDEMKAQDIKVVDVRGRSSFTDLMVIATGNSARHVKSLAHTVFSGAKDAGITPLGMEGEQQSDWVLVDLDDIIVHVMLASVRDYYNLEKLWETGPLPMPSTRIGMA